MPSPSLASTRLAFGIAPVDAHWQRLLPGGTYVLVGAVRQGRHRLSAHVVRAGVEAGERVLVFSSRPPEAVVAEAAAVGLDLPAAYRRGAVRLLQAPAADALTALGDDGLRAAFSDLLALAHPHDARRVVVEDFTPFVRFRAFEAFAEALTGLLAAARAHGTTLFLGLGEPATPSSQHLLRYVESRVTGTVRLQGEDAGGATLALVPGTGHGGALHTARWGEAVADEASDDASAPLTPADPVEHWEEAPWDGEDPLLRASGDSFREADPFLREADAFSGDGARRSAAPPRPERTAPAPSAPLPPPHDAVELTPIEPVPPASALPVDPLADLFALDASRDPLGGGHLVDSDEAMRTLPLEQATPAIHAAAYPELFASTPAVPDAHAAFRTALDAAFARREATPFLLLALRLDPAGPHAALFPALVGAVRAGLRVTDALLEEPASGRLAVVLPGAPADAASAFFGAVKAHLRGTLGAQADAALQAVHTVVVPDGRPFATPDELIRYVFG